MPAAPRMTELRFQWKKQRIPYDIFYELTPRCTFDCKMCYVHLTREQMGDRKELSTEEWLRIVDRSVKEGMLYCVLTGGECMLHEGFWQIYERILSYGVVLAVNTNAYALTDEDIARFAANPPGGIRITLYGASEEAYERLTGRRAFGRVVENIKKLKAAGLTPKLAATLTPWNMSDFPAMMVLARELGLRLGYTFHLTAANKDTGRQFEDYRGTPEEIARWELAGWKAVGRVPYQNEPITELPARMADDPNSVRLTCEAGRGSYTVHWDGRFSPCLNIPTELRLQDMSYEEAWEAAGKMVEKFPIPVECQSCRLRPVCANCALTRQNQNDPKHCDPYRCAVTVARWNAGLITLHPKHTDEVPTEDDDPEEMVHQG